ncbi:hypothetical protein SSS_06319 [Sarcoptes scabiei]|uniref:Uncharacterized protein n=1 Tax=Sarcoptes scabiei TaxID=52283 RepID=A0A834RHM5_SARSC|nr:hypothetical protein SSS_06319 [Sarcoptes scabiei]
MFQTSLLLFCLAATASAYGYGHGGTMGHGYGSGGYGGHGSVQAAIHSNHHIKYYDVPSYGHISPTHIEVGAKLVPITMVFRTKSSHLNVKQYHHGESGSHQESHSQDEPHYLTHTVKKPVYQEVHEVITPYRTITQEIKPVHEDIKTYVARKSHGYGGGGGSGGGYGYGFGHGPEYGIGHGGGGYSKRY